MSPAVFNACTYVLAFGVLAAFGLSGIYLIAALVGWRGPQRNRRLVRFGLFLGLVPVLAVIQYSLVFFVYLPSMAQAARRAAAERREASSVVRVGDPAPSFTLTTVDDQTFAIDELRGKVVLVNFFATWCGPCLMELPHLEEIWNQHQANERFALVVIGREETADSVQQFRSKKGYTFPMAADPERSTYSLYAEELIPRTYLIGADGKICFASTGYDEQDLKSLKREIERQLRAIR